MNSDLPEQPPRYEYGNNTNFMNAPTTVVGK